MGRTATFHVSPDGTISGLHYDDLDLGFLGPKRIGRASEILFDDEAQTFYVELPQLSGGHVLPGFLQGFSGYDVARAFEVMLLETCAISQMNPSYEGALYKLGTQTRARFDQGDREIKRWNGKSNGVSCAR